MRTQSMVPRGWIVFAQMLGTGIALIGLVVSFYFIVDVMNKTNPASENYADTVIMYGFIAGIVLYIVWKTLYSAIIIVRFVKNASSDEDIIANRYILAALSLTLGGFMTPMLLTSFRNMETASTIKPKWFLSRSYSMIMAIGGLLFLAGFLLLTLTNLFGNQPLEFKMIQESTLGIVALVGSIIILAIGAIGVLAFFGPNKAEIFEGNTGLSKFMRGYAVIFIVIATIELVGLMILSIFRLIGAIADLFSRFGQEGGIGKAFAIIWSLANLVMTFIYVMAIIRIAAECIQGIWKRDGIVIIKYDQKIADADARRLNSRNN